MRFFFFLISPAEHQSLDQKHDMMFHFKYIFFQASKYSPQKHTE